MESGTKLGPYEIHEQLGAGGMGEVYRATDTRLDRTVAIKVLREHLADDPESRERFKREAKAVSSLNDPHICALYDVGEQDGTHFLVMEYVEGETLQQRLDIEYTTVMGDDVGFGGLLEKGRLPLGQALEYAIQIADALDKAHRKGIVHRDLKPGNIMLTESGVKLLDFGLAKLKSDAGAVSPMSQMATDNDSGRLTVEGAILGTFQYMAPEQLEGKDVDARTDIFAFGAVVYEMVTGRRAFEGKSQVSLIASIMEHEPQSMSSLQATTPPSLDRLVRTCLAKDPYDRWQTAVDLKRELRWASQTEPTVSAERPSGAAWAKTLPVALGALIVGVLIAVMVTRIPLQPVEVTRTSVNVFPGTRLTGGVELETTVGFQRPSRQSLVFSPDGRHLIYAATDGEDTQLYLRQMDQAEGAPIRGTEGGSQPFFSSDGQFVGFFVGRDLMRVPIEGGEARTITSRGFVNWGASWTDEDTILLGGTDGVSQISANGGTLEQLTTVDPSRGEFGYFYPELLPGGQAVLFNVAGIDGIPGEWDIFVQSLESGERQLLVEGGSDPRYLASGHIAFARAGTLMAVPFDARLLEVTPPL